MVTPTPKYGHVKYRGPNLGELKELIRVLLDYYINRWFRKWRDNIKIKKNGNNLIKEEYNEKA